MTENKKDQLEYEITSWLRSLDFLQHENIMLKNRIASILQFKNIKIDLVDRLEQYQNLFISKDAVFAIFRKDIKEIRKSISENTSLETLNNKHDLLRVDMEKIENEFSKVKTEFNNYFSGIL